MLNWASGKLQVDQAAEVPLLRAEQPLQIQPRVGKSWTDEVLRIIALASDVDAKAEGTRGR